MLIIIKFMYFTYIYSSTTAWHKWTRYVVLYTENDVGQHW